MFFIGAIKYVLIIQLMLLTFFISSDETARYDEAQQAQLYKNDIAVTLENYWTLDSTRYQKSSLDSTLITNKPVTKTQFIGLFYLVGN